MRYHISFNVPSRVILGLLGSGPRQSWVDIRPDEVHARMGWLGEVTIPRVSIVSVERVKNIPWWLGLGLHGFFGTWAFNAALGNAVKITARSGARGRILVFPLRPHTIYFSLDKPDEFVHELTRDA
jgi:hypothetical protein